MPTPLPPLLCPPPPHDPLGACHAAIRRCVACGLAATRTQAVPGEGSRTPRLLVVGEAPGAEEDASGRPFVGRSGRLLRTLVAEAGLRDDEWFIANTVRCRPPANRTPTPHERATCAPHLTAELSMLAPQAIVLLGRTAAIGVLGAAADVPLGTIRGQWHGPVPTMLNPRHEGALPRIVVTFHPAAALRNPAWRRALVDDLALAAAGAA
jgi:uracil-DNA glycosylase family 4